MPTLNWIGKEKVINHHLDVPFRVLEHSYGFDNGTQSDKPTGSGNKIIHGDNLEALKALLPEYEGKIKCIYIDPPYNTGNEGWVYNDNVNDPKIKKWLLSVVGKEGEDLSRHDKWLCMMYPRLKLLYKLLSDDGAIFISIDDNEVHFLCLILDEIFGKPNFVANIVWQKRTSSDARATLGAAHEHIIVYGRKWDNVKNNLRRLPLNNSQLKAFKNPDNDPKGPWVSSDFTAQGFRPNQMYPIISPSGKKHLPPDGRCWKNIEPVFDKAKLEGRMWFGKDGEGVPRWKTYLNESEGIAAWTWWPHEEVGHSQEGKQEVNLIFQSATIFDTPKPSRLIERIIQLYVEPGEIILDSFAGSGTTGHSVLKINREDNGDRKFLLIEMESYADTTTAERVKRVSTGYDKFAPTGGSFDFYTLGKQIFVNEILNEEVALQKIREYIFYSETKTSLAFNDSDNPFFLDIFQNTAYYFYYLKPEITSLDHLFLSTIKNTAEYYVIYADNCLLTKNYMTRHNITFKKIPRDITRF